LRQDRAFSGIFGHGVWPGLIQLSKARLDPAERAKTQGLHK